MIDGVLHLSSTFVKLRVCGLRMEAPRCEFCDLWRCIPVQAKRIMCAWLVSIDLDIVQASRSHNDCRLKILQKRFRTRCTRFDEWALIVQAPAISAGYALGRNQGQMRRYELTCIPHTVRRIVEPSSALRILSKTVSSRLRNTMIQERTYLLLDGVCLAVSTVRALFADLCFLSSRVYGPEK